MNKLTALAAALGSLGALAASQDARASSHREAPFVTENPKVDATDFYMFRSYEAGRDAYTTFVANYIPLQDGYGGPNFFTMDPDALYEIHVDNDADAVEDLTFQFRFRNRLRDLQVPVGTGTTAQMVSVAITNVGQITTTSSRTLAIDESYQMFVVRGDRRTGVREQIRSEAGATSFRKPTDNYGTKTFGAGQTYEAYARAHVNLVTIPGCAQPGRVFVGQRKDPFFVTLGQVFDLVNVSLANVAGLPMGCDQATSNFDSLEDKNVTSIVLEVPTACLTDGNDPVIGGWTTASLRQARVLNPEASFDTPAREGGAWTQVSRLGMPLVNEVVIGLKDKNRFNASAPAQDPQFLTYVTHPSFPVLINALFGAAAARRLDPTQIPRTDLVDTFLFGLTGLNRSNRANITPGEYVRLNTSIAPTAAGMQDPMGVVGGDNAGFPNGRRPIDDVTDVVLRVAMGALIPNSMTPAYTDCTRLPRNAFDATFPYLTTPRPGGVEGF